MAESNVSLEQLLATLAQVDSVELERIQCAALSRREELDNAAIKRRRVSGGHPSLTVDEEVKKVSEMSRRPVTKADVAGKSAVRILLPGCFDIMHAGHYNALRQAKRMFDGVGVPVTLIAGMHGSQCIAQQKGPPVMTDDERCQIVSSCKWVDEVVIIPEYKIDIALLDKHRADFVVHGDDLPIRKDGKGMYDAVILANRFRMFKRTEGVSTTTFIGRILQTVRTEPSIKEEEDDDDCDMVSSSLLPTGARISAFSDGFKPIGDAKRIVYCDGIWDVFHHGHVDFLRQAKALGDYLLVGLHSDKIAQQLHGPGNPIMSLHERAMCVMSCKYVDDVIIGVPFTVTKDLCTSMNVSVVVSGEAVTARKASPGLSSDPYAAPKALKIFQTVVSNSTLTTQGVQERIAANYNAYFQRQKVQEEKQVDYIETKTFFKEQDGKTAAD